MHVEVDVDPVWDVLGPFPIGTRELPWGSDPLERVGGFKALEPDKESIFESSLNSKGFVKWSKRLFETDVSESIDTSVRVNLEFPDVDWLQLRGFYGWAGLQYQAWARGYFHIEASKPRSYEIFSDAIAEFNIDGQGTFGADFFRFRRAPLVIRLNPGRHHVNLRLFREIRSMGGNDFFVKAVFGIRPISTRKDLVVGQDHFLAPDLVDGKLSSPFASVPVRNTGTEMLEITDFSSLNDSCHISWAVKSPFSITLLPGQTRPLQFAIAINPSAEPVEQLRFSIIYHGADKDSFSSIDVQYTLKQRTRGELHKFTYLLPNGLVSYSMLRPPTVKGPTSTSSSPLPVMVFLHGAGVDADAPDAIYILDDFKHIPAWTIIPSGVTSWSGDDWHQWGWMDVESAILAINQWITNMEWSGPSFIEAPWLLTGHSNGGQGVYYGLTHHPDKLVAAAVAAGYSSVEWYVPYTFWHQTDPRRMAVLHAALNSYRHEVLMANANHIPLAQQHGADDDNVPCFHSRNIFQIAFESGSAPRYSEVPGAGHIFDGMMTTGFLKQFYETHLQRSQFRQREFLDFTLVVANPADTGPKSGVHVKQLIDPGQLGSVQAQFHDNKLFLTTSNVRALIVPKTLTKRFEVLLDSTSLPETSSSLHCLDDHDRWVDAQQNRVATNSNVLERWGNQLGNMDAILRSRGRFIIRYWDAYTKRLAVEISRNFFQHFAADTEIFEAGDKPSDDSGPGNLITIGVGSCISPGHVFEESTTQHPIRLCDTSLHIRNAFGKTKSYQHIGKRGIGAIFLRPLPNERLDLVVWGTDLFGLNAAARLVPFLTGSGQPDFVVLSSESRWRGIDGALAMGFFDSFWNVTASSFLQ